MISSRSRRRWYVLTAVTALALGTWATPASAGLPAAAGPATATAPAADQAAGASHTVTLITGDVVTYAPVEDGLPGIAIDPAPRPDGEPVTFTSFPDEGGYQVIPSDAAALVADGVLDPQLFDVETLVADGRAGEGPPPVIVGYAGVTRSAAAPARAAAALTGAEVTRSLPTLTAAAVEVQAGRAGDFWADLRAGAAGSRAGISNVWLDRRLEPMLDVSAATVGAPQAWAAGVDGTGARIAVIDTGIDAAHPDFAGRIEATANFTTDPDVTDHIGHGTHVASIAAGSGAGSGGRYTGVAPGASLLVAKVFDRTGFAGTSSIIDAMEWAATEGADVVNLSLGACCTWGTDPLSLALNALTEEHGTLFVASMGNEGQRERVPTPAAADHALAVAAGDKATGTRVVGISNGGPRFSDAAVKPNLVAPGDGIVAAAPGGGYVIRGGTSMAAPHVAGAAALLAQQHPDWDATRLREALQSTATVLDPDRFRWFDQGAGSLDVARLVSQQVYATSGVDLRVVDRDGGPVRRPVTYRNDGDEPVTLTLSVTAQGWSGNPAPAGAVSLATDAGTDTVTVPAGGEATVDLVVDPDTVPGAYGGWVRAESAGGEITLGTTFSYFNGPPLRLLDVTVTDGNGTAEFSTAPHHILRPVRWSPDPDNPWNPIQVQVSANAEGRIVFRVPAGEYELMTTIEEVGTRGRVSVVRTTHSLFEDKAATVTPEDTVPIRPVTPQPTDLVAGMVRYMRDNGDPRGVGGLVLTAPVSAQLQHGIWATPLAEPAVGSHLLAHQWTLDQALLTGATAEGAGAPGRLTPAYRPAMVGDTLAGRQRYPAVFAGSGNPDDLAGLDLAGALALVAIPVDAGSGSAYRDAVAAMNKALASALAAGAAGAVGYLDADGAAALAPQVAGLALGLPADQGRALRRAAESTGGVQVLLNGRTSATEAYRLRYHHEGTSPVEPVMVDPAGLATVREHYYAVGRDTASVTVGTDGPGSPMSLGEVVPVPSSRTVHYGPASPELSWNRQVNHDLKTLFSHHRFRPGEVLPDEHWHRAPLVPGTAVAPADPTASVVQCTLCRDADRFVALSYWEDTDPARWDSIPAQESARTQLFRLGADGEQEMPIRFGRPISFEVPAGDAARYRYESVNRSRRSLSTEVTTVAEFDSRPAAGEPAGYRCNFGGPCAFQPILRLGYDLPLDQHNRARADRPLLFTVSAAGHPAAPRLTATGLAVEYSVDDGAGWQPVRSLPGRPGQFRFWLPHPPLADTNGFVSLRVTTTDSAGGSIQQTVLRAYALR